MPIGQIKKLRPRKILSFSQGHIAVRVELDFDPRFLGSLALSQSVAAAPSGEDR